MYNKSSQSSQNHQKVPLETSLPHNAESQLPSISPPAHTPIPEEEVELTSARSAFHSSRSKPLPSPQASETQPVVATRPPLSERDSIFATTYSSSPPTRSDPFDAVDTHDGAASQSSPTQSLEAHRLTGLANTAYNSGRTPPVANQRTQPITRPGKRRSPATSYFDPTDLVRSRLLANNRYAQNMATLDESLRETSTFDSSPIDSPSSERPTTSSSASSALQFIESEADKEERSRYRLWRQGQGAMEGRLLYGGKTRSGDRTRVDKKIEATLPKADAGNAAARSRKASQYLGLFRENEAEEEQKRVNDDSREGRSPGRDRSKSGRASRRQTPRGDAGTESDYFGKYNLGQSGLSPQPGPQITPKFKSSPLSPDARGAVGPHEQTFDSPQTLSPISTREEADTGLKPAGLNVTPEVITPSRLPQVTRLVQQHQEDSEDSEHEQISSALYFPHRQVIPEIADGDLERQSQSARRPPGPEETTAVQTPPNRSQASEDLSRSPDEVEISLRSKNETKVWHGDLPNVPDLTEDEQLTYSSSHASGSETESGTESTQSEYGYGSNTSDNEATPKARPRANTKHHRQQKNYKEPRGAVELKPFNHQVGGHSTVYRFSRRAICKQLNNRENEFYETVERYHPELVQFMPKYIGVLNVTYRKGPKRQKTLATEDKVSEASAADSNDKSGPASPPPPSEQNLKPRKGSESSPRIVSHSQQQSEQQAETPRVMVENNRHLIPPSLFRSATARPQTPGPARSPSLLTQMHRASLDSRSKSDTQFKQDLAERSPIKHHDSWGNTTVNRSLQEQILREVFAAPLIHRHHRHGKTHTSSLSHQSKDAVMSMRRGSSDVSGMHSSFSEGTESMHEQILKAKKDHASRRQEEQEELVPLRTVLTEDSRARVDPHEDEVVIRSRALSDQHKKLRRRHSGGGLKRRPLDIDSNRGNLEFHEEEGYGGDTDEVFHMDDEQKAAKGAHLSIPQITTEAPAPPALPTIPSVSRENTTSPAPELGSPIEDLPVYGPEPLNPKQAQMNLQHDENERVQLFILLEDLTAGMSKPCVLDLKMGTRQYGVEADEKKQKSQRRKCKMTTSRGLGVRVCGMQVWNTKEQHFHFEDKYFGRDLKAGQPFQAALMRFFDDGHGRHDIALKHIPTILEQLRKLEGIIKKLPGYRFYASSLLMIYDRGDATNAASQHNHHHRHHHPPDTGKIRLKIVDFANCVTAEDPLPPTTRCPPQNRDGIDTGYLRGVRSLRMYFQQIWREVKTEMGSFVQRGEGEGMAMGVGAHGEWGIGDIAGPGWEDDLGMPSDGNTEVEGDVST